MPVQTDIIHGAKVVRAEVIFVGSNDQPSDGSDARVIWKACRPVVAKEFAVLLQITASSRAGDLRTHGSPGRSCVEFRLEVRVLNRMFAGLIG